MVNMFDSCHQVLLCMAKQAQRRNLECDVGGRKGRVFAHDQGPRQQEIGFQICALELDRLDRRYLLVLRKQIVQGVSELIDHCNKR